ncbi:MAG: capsular polysaccharide biosynthesis protein [Paracoccaceae bacterium]
MSETEKNSAVGPEQARRLFIYNTGFLTQRRVRRILGLAGWRISLGFPKEGDAVGVWGQSPTAHRGEKIAAEKDAPIVRIEDAFLRSLFPGRSGEPPMGLLIDESGVHFDPTKPSDLETLLATHPLDDTALLDRSRGAMARMAEAHLSKYSAFNPELDVPAPGYVLVLDQTRGDASVRASRANVHRFQEMLFVAQEEHPGTRILIKTHPETVQGHRAGYFEKKNENDRVKLYDAPVSPWRLMEGAVAVYTVSSGLGFEAILAGHKPRVFGQPFYAGWGLTSDEDPVIRRQRKLTRAQLFAAAMILYPKWYDPFHDTLCELEDVIETLAAQSRAWRADHQGWVASGMRLWKRPALQKTFGQQKRLIFTDTPAKARQTGRPWMIWAGKAQVGDEDAVRVEDGFLRSKGLGAELVPPVSLVTDDLGIYYDPSRPSRLEELIRARRTLRPEQMLRVDRLQRLLVKKGVSKYNLAGLPPALPDGHKVLVIGQVEDDASIRLGAGDTATNDALLKAAHHARPDAVILYKPHPDVEAGLRPGKITTQDLAHSILSDVEITSLFPLVDEVWTMTSLSGFEALLRGVPVVTTGAPFYAGWGLTEDRGTVPPRRREDVSLAGLIHATLIDYPRYTDPVTGLPCSVEVIVQRLSEDANVSHPGSLNRLLSKLQGAFASHAHIWRR